MLWKLYYILVCYNMEKVEKHYTKIKTGQYYLQQIRATVRMTRNKKVILTQ